MLHDIKGVSGVMLFFRSKGQDQPETETSSLQVVETPFCIKLT